MFRNYKEAGFSKPLAAIALIFIFVLTASCSGKDTGTDGDDFFTFPKTSEDSSVSEKYIIVLPQNSGTALYDKASELAVQIRLYSSCDAEIVFDHLVTKNPSEGGLIFVGSTSFSQSLILLNTCRANDYGYIRADENIVIGGIFENTTITAIDKFMTEVLPYFDGTELLPSNREYIFEYPYAIDYIRLGNIDISGYSIVYPAENINSEERAAYLLQSEILKISGFHLNIYSDENKVSGKIIAVGKVDAISAQAQTGKITYASEDGNFAILAADSYGLSLGVKNFADKIAELGKGSTSQLDLDDLAEFSYSAPDVSLLHFDFSDYNNEQIAVKIYQMTRVFTEQSNVLYSFSNMSYLFYSELIKQHNPLISNFVRSDGHMSGYFYNPEKLNETEAARISKEGYNLIYSRFEYIGNNEVFLFFHVSFSDFSKETIVDAAIRIEEIAGMFSGIPVFVSSNIENSGQDEVFGAAFVTLGDGKSKAMFVDSEQMSGYNALWYTDYDYCDTSHYKEAIYYETGDTIVTKYVLVRFTKTWVT